ncbi:MAG TPA: hypothetical protein VGG72_34220 [Bryobacteraceae bacterium]|jgi:hypothetical protein
MASFVNPSQRLKPGTTVVSLTTVQCALWQLGMPILDADAVAGYKRRAKRGMLWLAIRWQLLGMAALVGLVCLGREWGRAAIVGLAAVVLATLFGWLVNAADLQWTTLGYGIYRSLHAVPPHVSAAANALMRCGVSESQIGVEYLKNDPILFVKDPGFVKDAGQTSGVRRYDLIVWQ